MRCSGEAEQRVELLGGDGAAEMEALGERAAAATQEGALAAVSTPSTMPPCQRSEQLVDRRRRRGRLGLARARRQERAVDLSDLHRQLAQPGQRGVARAEVVDRDAMPASASVRRIGACAACSRMTSTR